MAARREQLRQVLERHGVRNARIFGSVARGDDHQGSDLDILVDFAPRTSLFTILRIQDELEAILGVPVDLVPDSGLKHRVRVRVQQDPVRIRLLEIGEAVKSLPENLTSTEPDISWRQIARMRDHRAHRYFMTELEILQSTIEEDLGPLRDAVDRMRARSVSGSGEDSTQSDSAG